MKYTDSSDLNKVMESYSYTYDKNDNIKSKTVVNNYPAKDSDKINETKAYTYDALGRLTKTDITNNSTKKTSSITYGYDKVGNRTSMTKDGATTAYSYNKLNQLTKSTETKDGKEISNKVYTYDPNGNQTKEKDSVTNITVENTYDVDNRLSTSITVNGTKEVVNQENLYNGNGKRIQKKEGNNAINYFYQDGVVLYTTDKDGNKTSQNFIGTDGNVIGTIRYSTEGFKYYTYNKDIQGSTTSVVGQDGTSPVAYDYDDFGVTKTIGDSTFFNELCYTGGIYDVSTGLYYLNARYYNPNNGRFITQDTYRGKVNTPETLHLYAYCANNPINYVDPSGHWIETVVDVASTGYSLATFMKQPSWLNAGYLLWDVGATFIPFLPGSYVKRSGKLVVKVADKTSDFRSKRKGLTIGKYKSLRKIKYSKKVEIHHIIEKRFKKLRLNERDYPSVPLTPELHRRITKRWRQVVPYKKNYEKLTKEQLIRYCRIVYNDMPELRKVATDTIIKYYKK